MELYRIAQEAYAEDLTGNGSRLYGGRWNSEGIYALYTSSARSLALLEILANTPAKMLQVKEYYLVTLSVPDSEEILVIDFKKLPAGWNGTEISPGTQRVGNEFLMGKNKLLMEVPSVLIPEEKNFVINPRHPEMKKVKIIDKRIIDFDKRFFASKI